MIDLSKMEYEDFNVGDRIQIDRRFILIDAENNKIRVHGKTGTITERLPSFVKVCFDDDIPYIDEEGNIINEIWFGVDKVKYEEEQRG